jgi:hypothetical protein
MSKKDIIGQFTIKLLAFLRGAFLVSLVASHKVVLEKK